MYCLRQVSAEEPKPCTITMAGAALPLLPALANRILWPLHSQVLVSSAPYTGTDAQHRRPSLASRAPASRPRMSTGHERFDLICYNMGWAGTTVQCRRQRQRRSVDPLAPSSQMDIRAETRLGNAWRHFQILNMHDANAGMKHTN